MKKEIILDEAAQDLFKALGGIDTSERAVSNGSGQGDLSSALGEEETRMDEWRILMVEFISRLGGHLRGLRLTGMTGPRASEVDDLFQHLSQLSRMPDHGSRILLRFRGMLSGLGGRGGREVDYVLSYGPLTVDIPIVKSIVSRRGVGASHLPGRLASAFELFSSMEIATCHISLKAWTEETKEQMRLCLQALGRYFVGSSRAASLLNRSESQPGATCALVLDPHQKPDPNLTMLAGVNRLTIENVQGLADKVSQMLRQADAASPLHQHANTYEAMFAFKNLREKLARPPIEINNVRWLIAERDDEVVSREKAAVGRLVMEKFCDAPAKAALLMQSIYGGDFPDLAADALHSRLGRVTDFLEKIEADGDVGQQVEKEVLGSVRERLDQVPDDVFDNLSIGDRADKDQPDKGAEGAWRLHEKLRGMVSFFKRRFGTRQKIRQMMHHPVDFDVRDYETIAEDFGITLEDARTLVELLKSSFDEKGRFLRLAFERNIPAFARYEKKVFEFLWHYLKEIERREDRVAFLNSVQTLIAQMKQRERALKIILSDFVKAPEHVSFSDRNALILANLLLRKYNKELRMDIEISPEEILRVRDGLDVGAVREMRAFLDEKREPVFKKMRTVHRKTKEMIDGRDNGSPIPVRYLLSLERECYIFLSLVGGPVARRIIYGAVKEYGDPASEIYHLARSSLAIKGLTQILRVAVRGLGRLAEPEDLALLREVKDAEAEFCALTKDEAVRYALAGVMKWISNAIG
jgi:hypothetical protein